MIPLKNAMTSTVGKKFLIAVCGLIWVLFLLSHMIANLQLLLPTGDYYNAYSFGLIQLGPLLWVAEAGLVVTIVVHAVLAIRTNIRNRAARGSERYAKAVSKGAPSRANFSTRSMAITGVTLLIFLFVHIKTFKLGPAEAQGYVTLVNGQEMRDLYRLVHERFQEPLYTSFYIVVMGMLWVHLRHGFWSAFQSLGAMSPRWARPMHYLGLFVAFMLAVGFVGAPLWIFFVRGA